MGSFVISLHGAQKKGVRTKSEHSNPRFHLILQFTQRHVVIAQMITEWTATDAMRKIFSLCTFERMFTTIRYQDFGA